jgi:histidyl-tRNA synthetase
MDQPLKPKKRREGGQILSLRGMRDFLPHDFLYREKVERTAAKIAESFGYQRIDTPILEPAPLFERTIGEGTDIVEKEMYTFLTKGKDKVTLRPEFTASVARAFVENGMKRWVKPVRL